MLKLGKKHGFIHGIKKGLNSISNTISESIFSQIAKSAENVMKNIDNRIKLIEERILRKLASLFIILFGGVLLIFALIFFLINSLGWNNALVYFSLGIIILVMGLILKLGEINRQ